MAADGFHCVPRGRDVSHVRLDATRRGNSALRTVPTGHGCRDADVLLCGGRARRTPPFAGVGGLQCAS